LNSFDKYFQYKKVLKENNVSPKISPKNGETASELVNIAANILKSAIVSDKNLTDNDLKTFGFTMDTMLISCFFDGIACNANDFTWSYSYQYGSCYTFNAAKDNYGNATNAKRTRKFGPNSGLSLELFTGAPGIMNFTTVNLFQNRF